MSSPTRVQLALNVTDLEAAVGFYTKLFGVEPAKRRPGYANFAVAEPPLKLVLLEGQGQGGTLNHLGVEVGSAGEVEEATERLGAAGLATATEDAVSCCYAVQDKVWVDDPDGAPWEIYTVLADAGALEDRAPSGEKDAAGDGACACGVAALTAPGTTAPGTTAPGTTAPGRTAVGATAVESTDHDTKGRCA